MAGGRVQRIAGVDDRPRREALRRDRGGVELPLWTAPPPPRTVVHPSPGVPMDQKALNRSLIVGTIVQLLMIAVGHFSPGLMGGNFFPIFGTSIGAATGVMYGLWAKGASAGQAAMGGALAGGVAGVLGAAASAALGDVPGSTVGIAGVSTLVSGALGAVVGRIIGART